MKRTTRVKPDLYQQVTEKMIELLSQGVAPWRCTWSRYGAARNIATGRHYSGINAFFMHLTKHPIPYFMSFKQAKAKGGKVCKGAKSERVFFYKTLFKDADGNYISREAARSLAGAGEDVSTLPVLKQYRVFNIADIEGIEIDTPEVTLTPHERIEACEQIVSGMNNPPRFIHRNADKPYYSPLNDALNMPKLEQFTSAEEYYCTLFHELVHSTGHQSRLCREGITKLTPFGSPTYSREELIAEMGAAFLCARAGIDVQEVTQNSAAYLQGWITALKGDKKLIFKAAAEAQKAVDAITGTTRHYED